jgi:hypothetical protein
LVLYLRKGDDCLFLHLFKCLTLKKFLKIFWRSLLVIFLLILAAFIFIETPYGQNWLGRQVVKRFSRELQTKIEFKKIRFSLFNKMNLEGFLLEDQKHDTLLYADNLQVRITDWFFFKNKADLKYVAVENGVIHLNRTDSLWNYQFLVNYFTPTSQSPQKKSGIEFDLKKLSLKNVVVIQKDPWGGQDMVASVGDLEMDAKEISLAKKSISITSLSMVNPVFNSYNYPGKGMPHQKTDTVITHPKTAADVLLKWNAAGWVMNIDSMTVKNGIYKNDKHTERSVYNYFDGQHIEFSAINGSFTNVRLLKDTFSAKAVLKAKERSGFEVKSMISNVHLDPQGMYFNNLDLRTNRSTIRNYFAMTYNDIADMSNFIHRVKMQANFDNSYIDAGDLAYFSPSFKTWNKNISITGRVRGTVDDIAGRDLIINAGNGTYINGDVTLTGLPDINSTFIDLKSNDLRTNYSDMLRFIPAIRKVTQPDLARLGNIHFTGSFTGFITDFVTFGTIRTNLGTVKADLNMKLPAGKDPVYSGNIATTDFHLGTFIHDPKLGLVSFSGIVKGHGFDLNELGVDMKATIDKLDYNGYRYRNIVTNGKFEKKIYDGYAAIDDPNLKATLNGLISLGDHAKYDFIADVQQANLGAIKLVDEDLSFHGHFDLNFTGNNIDNFLGSARISHAGLVRNNQPLSFDSLAVTSTYKNGEQVLSVSSNEFDGNITGDFHISDLPNAIQLFLNKYYPSYVKAPAHVITHQNFRFDLETREVDQLVQLFDNKLSGFNDSKFSGSLNLLQNHLDLTADIPRFSYGQYQFNSTSIKGSGDLNQLNITGNVGYVAINDSINLPNATFELIARRDSSNIKLSTSANQAVSKANLNASVITYRDGIKINFDTSSFVLNGKTWTIDQGGQLNFRKNTNTSGEVVLHEENQEIRLRTVPSSSGEWNDLLVDLNNVNMGDIVPYVMPKARIEGLVSGSAKIQNPGSKMIVTGDLRTKYLRLNGDSLGEVNINKLIYDAQTTNLQAQVNNPDPEHKIDATVNIFLDGKHADNSITLKSENYYLNFLDMFLGKIFSDVQGYATANMEIKGPLNKLNYIGKARLHDAGLRVRYTQVFYKIRDADIDFKEHELDFGVLKLLDTVTKNTATFSGSIQHDSWKNIFYDLEAKVDDRPMTLLNTTAADNPTFYGHAVGTGSMILVGPQSDMALIVNAKASEQDSSHITIPPSRSRSAGMAEFLVERTHGQSMSDSLALNSENNITYDIDLTADPHTTIDVILDDVTGDFITGRGRGSLNIHSGTTEALTLNGAYDIEEGNYFFTFQSFFHRNFELKKNANNYIRWNGDPGDATINFEALYKASKVSFAPLASSLNISNVQGIRDDVYVDVIMSGQLFKPKFDFKLEFPPSSVALTDPTLAINLTQIENNPNEINKQVTYLIVFNSFAPVENTGAAVATNSSPAPGSLFNELAYSTISSLLFNEVNRVFGNILAKIFKDEKLKVNISGSVYNRNLINPANNNFEINASNVNVSVSRGFFNDRFVITAGSTLDIPLQNSATQNSIQQNIEFLPDVRMEWLINPSGSIRATFFYEQNLDFYNLALTNSLSRNRRQGAGISYRKEFDHLGDLFRFGKKKKKQQLPAVSTPSAETPIQQAEPQKGTDN